MFKITSEFNKNYSLYTFQPVVFLNESGVECKVNGYDLPRQFTPASLIDYLQMKYNINRKNAKELKCMIMKHARS